MLGHIASLIPPLFIGVRMLNQESVDCICVLSVSMLPLHLRFSFAFFLVFLIVENVVNKQLKYLY